MSYLTKTADPASRPYFFVRIEGIPSFAALGTADSSQLLLSTLRPSFDVEGHYLAVLDIDRFGQVEQRIQPDQWKVDRGTLTFVAGDFNGPIVSTLAPTPRAGDRALSRLLARVPAPVTRLRTNCTAVAAVIDVDDSSVFTVNEVVYLGRETMKVNAINPAGANTIGVTRGICGSTAAAHLRSLDWDMHADGIYDAPPYWEGRVVELRANYVGELEGEARVLSRGRLRSVEWTGDAWEFRASDVSAVVGSVLRDQLVGVVQEEQDAMLFTFVKGRLRATRWRSSTARIYLEVPIHLQSHADQPGVPVSFDEVQVNGYDIIAETNESMTVHQAEAIDAGFRGPITATRVVPAGGTIREVIPVRPDVTAPFFAPVPAAGPPGVPSDHPIDLYLCFLLSTGTGTNYTPGQTNYDVLPAPCGRGVPVTQVDVASFERVRALEGVAGMRLGGRWFVEPMDLGKWFEGEVGPLLDAAQTVTLTTGQVMLVPIGRVYPLDATTVIQPSDHDGPRRRMSLGYESVLGEVVASGPDGTLVVRDPILREWYGDTNRKAEWKFGPGAVSGNAGVIAQRAIEAIATSTRRRRWKSGISWRLHLVEASTPVAITDLHAPNDDGTIGFTSRLARIMSRRFTPTSTAGHIQVEALLMDGLRVANTPPAARVTAWDGANLDLTVAANDYTLPDGNAPPRFPGRDALGFEVAHRLDLWTADLATRRNDDAGCGVIAGLEVAGVNTIRLAAAFASGGVPLVPNVGDIVRFTRYDNAWTTSMKQRAALSDVGGHPGATTDAAYVWG